MLSEHGYPFPAYPPVQYNDVFYAAVLYHIPAKVFIYFYKDFACKSRLRKFRLSSEPVYHIKFP